MHIHHLNCGTDCPFGGAFFDGRGAGPLGRLVCHCLLAETPSRGLVLVDTGYGLRDVHHPHDGSGPAHHPNLPRDAQHPAQRGGDGPRQIEGPVYKTSDVRHIVLTHLDFDHAGGLEDFPHATVHVMDKEYRAATGQREGFVPRDRYRPRQFDEIRSWKRYRVKGEPWFGFEAVRDLDGLPPEILMAPLPGHTWGHAGIAVQGQDGWLLHAGDAYFYRHEVRRRTRACTPGLRVYQTLMETDRRLRLANQKKVRRLSIEKRGEVQVICAHDPVEFERCAAGRPL